MGEMRRFVDRVEDAILWLDDQNCKPVNFRLYVNPECKLESCLGLKCIQCEFVPPGHFWLIPEQFFNPEYSKLVPTLESGPAKPEEDEPTPWTVIDWSKPKIAKDLKNAQMRAIAECLRTAKGPLSDREHEDKHLSVCKLVGHIADERDAILGRGGDPKAYRLMMSTQTFEAICDVMTQEETAKSIYAFTLELCDAFGYMVYSIGRIADVGPKEKEEKAEAPQEVPDEPGVPLCESCVHFQYDPDLGEDYGDCTLDPPQQIGDDAWGFPQTVPCDNCSRHQDFEPFLKEYRVWKKAWDERALASSRIPKE